MRIMMTIPGSMFVNAEMAQHGHPMVHCHTQAVCGREVWNKLTAWLLTSLSVTIKS